MNVWERGKTEGSRRGEIGWAAWDGGSEKGRLQPQKKIGHRTEEIKQEESIRKHPPPPGSQTA